MLLFVAYGYYIWPTLQQYSVDRSLILSIQINLHIAHCTFSMGDVCLITNIETMSKKMALPKY